MAAQRLFHTLRHLKLRQLYGQCSRRFLPCRHRPERVPLAAPLAFPGLRRAPRQDILPPSCSRNSRSAILNGHFDFLNHSVSLGFPPSWNKARSISKLWTYNLHYFEWLHLLPYPQARAVVEDWMPRTPANRHAEAWEPYPTSLRTLTWILYFFQAHFTETQRDSPFCHRLWQSLAQQLNYLGRNLETHLLGNHLLENVATLTLAGTLFKGDLAHSWRLTGQDELIRQIKEQFLADGLHFELSPMYHLRTLYLLYLIHTLGDSQLQSLTRKPLERGSLALRKLTHPDGEIALFNDSALGIYHQPEVLLAAIETGLRGFSRHSKPADLRSENSLTGAWSLPKSGYYGFRDANGNYLVCDGGPIGPDYIPGHAHGDLFSFELSLSGHRIIVDTGNYDYVSGSHREFSRSTRAHNTVTIDDRDQSDFWGVFRVGRRAYPEAIDFEPKPGGFKLSGRHSGYDHAPLYARHERHFELGPGFTLSIRDRIRSKQCCQLKSHLHLAPDCEALIKDNQTILVTYPKGTFTIHYFGPGALSSEKTNYYPEFGKALERLTLCFVASGTDIETGYTICPSDSAG